MKGSVLFLAASLALAATQGELVLRLEDLAGPGETIVASSEGLVRLRIDPAATDAYDPGLDSEAPPAPPPPYVELLSWTSDFIATVVDARSGAGGTEEWDLIEIAFGGFGLQDPGLMRLSWDPSAGGEWRYEIHDEYTGQTYDAATGGSVEIYVPRTASYLFRITASYFPEAPRIESPLPPPGEDAAPLDSVVSFLAADDGIGVDPSSIVVRFDGADVSGSLSKVLDPDARRVWVGYLPPQMAPGSGHTVEVELSDLGGAPASASWTFTARGDLFGLNLRVNDDGPGGDQGGPVVAAGRGEKVFCVWEELRPNGRYGIVGAVSEDGGVSFGANRILTPDASNQTRPAMCVDTSGSGDVVYVFYLDDRAAPGYTTDVFGLWSDDDFETVHEFALTYDLPVQGRPACAAALGRVAVAWADGGNPPGTDVRVAVSEDRFEDVEYVWVTDGVRDAANPSVAVTGTGVVAVAWEDREREDEVLRVEGRVPVLRGADIHLARSDDDYATETAVADAEWDQLLPSLAASGEELYLVWQDGRDGDFDVYFAASADAYANLALTDTGSDAIEPALAVGASAVHVAWEDYSGTGAPNIRYRRSPDQGVTFYPDVRVDSDPTGAGQVTPEITLVGGRGPLVVWTDARLGDPDIVAARLYEESVNVFATLSAEAAGDQTVGPATGALDGLTLTFPPGSLAMDADVAVKEVVGVPALPSGAVGEPFALGPGFLPLRAPVTVEAPHPAGSHGSVISLYRYDFGTGEWVLAAGEGSDDAAADPHVATVELEEGFALLVQVAGHPSDWGHPDSWHGGTCFIATAAWGTPLAEEVERLRTFRDDYLATTPLGRFLLRCYARLSPPLARLVAERPVLAGVVRTGIREALAFLPAERR